jgi:hypothetical protein
MFEMLKQEIKGRVFQAVEENMTVIDRVWDELTLEELQFAFFNLVEILEYVIEHIIEYCINWH